MIVNLCTTVYKRHDLLTLLVRSLLASTRVPDRLWVVDHGYDFSRVHAAVTAGGWPADKLTVVTLEDPGVAHSANWCFKNIVGEKIFCSDDIQFTPDAIEKLLAVEADFVLPDSPQNAFACCLIRDSCYSTVGPFDETISPRYLYFEDCDYAYRMKLKGVPMTPAKDCAVIHHNGGSQTFKSYTAAEMREHHRKFALAQNNYLAKWGGLPYHEKFTTPGGR